MLLTSSIEAAVALKDVAPGRTAGGPPPPSGRGLDGSSARACPGSAAGVRALGPGLVGLDVLGRGLLEHRPDHLGHGREPVAHLPPGLAVPLLDIDRLRPGMVPAAGPDRRHEACEAQLR